MDSLTVMGYELLRTLLPTVVDADGDRLRKAADYFDFSDAAYSKLVYADESQPIVSHSSNVSTCSTCLEDTHTRIHTQD